MRRFVLRKSMFGSLREQPIRMHEPQGERRGAAGRLVLLRSETDPRVRRWKRVDGQAKVFYSEKQRMVLREAMKSGTMLLHKKRLEDPEVRQLVDHGMLELQLEPAHHSTEYTARITKAGKAYIKQIDANVAKKAKESQLTMFKGAPVRFLINLRKAKQLGLFGGAPPAPAPHPSVVEVKTHVARDAHGVHLVHEHQRHLAAAARPAPVAKKKPAAPDLASTRASDARFEGLTVEGYFRAGTPEASEWVRGDFSDVSCVRCGAKISHVFATNHGNMGGDCLATLTGDDSTRRLARQLNTKLGTWAAKGELYGFQVGTSAHTGATIRGLYSRDGRSWDYLLWASDSAPAAMVHGIVEQFTQHHATRPLVFRAAIDRAHVEAQVKRQEARKAAIDERAAGLLEEGAKIARTEALAHHYQERLAGLARQVPGTWWRPTSSSTDGKATLTINETGDGGGGPQLIEAARKAGFEFVRDTREGLMFRVPSVEAMEEAGAEPVSVGSLDDAAFQRALEQGMDPIDALYAATPADPSSAERTRRIQAAHAAIEARAADKTDYYARNLAMKRYGSASMLRKGTQLGLFGGARPAAEAPAAQAHTPTTAPAGTLAAPASDDFTAAQVREMRGDGLVVYGYLGEKKQGGNPQERGTGPEYGDTRTVYKIERFFFPQRKGQPHIPPVEVLTRTLQVYGKKHSGKPPFTYTKDTWLNQRDTEGLVEVKAGAGWFKSYTPEAWAPPLPGGTEPRRVYGQRLEGHFSETVPCDARCTMAKGHKCECSCGGANHGTHGVIRTWHARTPAEIKKLLIEHGAPRRAVLLRKADGGPKAAPRSKAPIHGLAPAARGLQLVTSKQNPRVKRWERTQEQAKPPSDHVKFTHPDTGEERTGQVIAGGAKGVTVVDHETGKTAKVHHGHYVASEPPNAGAEPAKKAPKAPKAAAAGPAKPAGEDWRGRYPGLNKYPPPEVKPDIGGPTDDWKLRWRSPGTGKMVQAYETAYLRDNARDKFRRISAIGARLPELRTTLDTHLSLHPDSPAAVKAAMVRLVDHTAMRAGNEDSATKGVHGVSTLLKKHVRVEGDTVHLSYVGKASVPQEHTVKDAKVAAVVKHLLAKPGERLFQADDGRGTSTPVTADHLNDYVRTHLGEDHTLKDLRTFHATRLFSEAADKLGPPKKGEDAEEKVQAAALEVAKHLGHKKAMKRGHFAVHDGEADHDVVVKHGGKLYMHGKRRAVGFHTAADKKAYIKATGAADLPKGEHPDVEPEWKHEPMTSLNNYIDPTVVEAYRNGLTLSGSLAKGSAGYDGLSADERRFVSFLGKVREMDPYKFRGGQP